jgi:hypothetical protein
MNRRDFLKSSAVAASSAALVSGPSAVAADDSQRQYYELRLYHVARGAKTEAFDHFYKDAAIPALKRAGVDRVGVFAPAAEQENPAMYVLIAYPSLDSIMTTQEKLLDDAELKKAGADFLNCPATDPAYARVDISLMVAFSGMPKLEPPSLGPSRVYELRTYESHSTKANFKKVEMFNRWEIAIFRRTGLTPVFFGQNRIGANLPSLTYMLAFENQAAHDKAWATFIADDEWKKVSKTPGFTDPEIVSKINRVFLRPTAYSEI